MNVTTFSFPPYHHREDPTHTWFSPLRKKDGIRKLGIDPRKIASALHNGPWEKNYGTPVSAKTLYEVANCKVQSFDKQQLPCRNFPRLVCPVDKPGSTLMVGNTWLSTESLDHHHYSNEPEKDGFFPELPCTRQLVAKGTETNEQTVTKRKTPITDSDGTGNISVTVTTNAKTQTPIRLPKIGGQNPDYMNHTRSSRSDRDNIQSINSSIDRVLIDDQFHDGNDVTASDRLSVNSTVLSNRAKVAMGNEKRSHDVRAILRSPCQDSSKSSIEKHVTFASGDELNQFRVISPPPEKPLKIKVLERKAKSKRKSKVAHLADRRKNSQVISNKLKQTTSSIKDRPFSQQVKEKKSIELKMTSSIKEPKTAMSDLEAIDSEEETILALDSEGNLIERKLGEGCKGHVTVAELRWHVQQEYICENCNDKKNCGTCGVPQEGDEDDVSGVKTMGRIRKDLSLRTILCRRENESDVMDVGMTTEGRAVKELTRDKEGEMKAVDSVKQADWGSEEDSKITDSESNPFVTKCVAWNETTVKQPNNETTSVDQIDSPPKQQKEEIGDLTELLETMRKCRYIRWPKQYRELLAKADGYEHFL